MSPTPSSTVTLNEDTPFDIMLTSIADVDTTLIGMTIEATSFHGDLSVPSSSDYTSTPINDGIEITWINPAATTITFTWSPHQDYNNVNGDGTDTINILFTDSDRIETSLSDLTVDVNAINDPPILTGLPTSTIDLNENTVLTISGITISDIDINDVSPTAKLRVTLSISPLQGGLTLSSTTGITFLDSSDGSDDQSMEFEGLISDIQTSLTDLRYYLMNTNVDLPVTIIIILDDQGESGTGGSLTITDTIDILVHSIPDDSSSTGSSEGGDDIISSSSTGSSSTGTGGDDSHHHANVQWG